jgi:hypothetical protein
MANIYQAGGKAVSKAAKLSSMAAELFAKGKTSSEIRETLAEKVPSATSSDIEQAVTPTLQSKVEKGKELVVVEPGLARPVRPELSTETALVPTGRPAKTTFIAGEQGVSAGEQPVVEARTLEERIRPRPQEGTTPPSRPAPTTTGLSATQKTGIGLAAAGAAGMALRPGEEKKKEQPAGLLRPRIVGETYKDIKFEPSPAELEDANSKAGMDGVRSLWNTYSALNAEFQNKAKTEGFTMSDPKAAASAFLQTKQPATGPGILATPLTGDQFSKAREVAPPAPAAKVPDSKKEKQAEPAPLPGGVAAKQRPQPKTIAESVAGQVKTAETAQDVATAVTDKLASGQPISRGELLGLVQKINAIQPAPAQADDASVKALRAAREEARQAYREQATRNEWSEVAQTVSNAIANFISAQQGLAGKPLALPQVDYGERTARALREYQTELGSITEQERAMERGVERKQAASEREAEASRRGWERYLMLGEKQIEAEERKAERERDLATRLQIATAQQEQEKARLDAAARKEEKKVAKEGGKEQLSFLDKSIRQTEDLIKETERKLQNATAVAAAPDSKAFSEALPAYSIGAGVDLSQYSKAGILSGEKYQQDEVKKQAKGRAAELSAELQRLSRIREEKQNQYDTLLSGGQPTRPAAPAGQQPATGGKVITSADVADYAKKQGASTEDAAAFLAGQGYTIRD